MAEEALSLAPSDRRYTREHEWARLEGDGSVVVGITDYAAHELGDVVYVQLPAAGSALKQFEKFGEIESVKAVSDLFSPVSGEVAEANDALLQSPELVNQSPFDDGWMLRVRISGDAALDGLLDAAAYGEYLRGLGHPE